MIHVFAKVFDRVARINFNQVLLFNFYSCRERKKETFQFSFLRVKKEVRFPSSYSRKKNEDANASSSLAKALSRKLCHRVDIFRVHPTFDHVVVSSDSSESPRYSFLAFVDRNRKRKDQGGDEELELRTIASARIG